MDSFTFGLLGVAFVFLVLRLFIAVVDSYGRRPPPPPIDPNERDWMQDFSAWLIRRRASS